MTFPGTPSNLRFRYRHVHATMFDYVKTSLVGLGWGDAGLPASDPANAAVNFATTPATYLEFQPDESGVKIAVNTVAITLGDEPASEDEEMGPGLQLVRFPVFVDIYGANQAISHSIASDVKHMLENHYQQVMDHTVSPPAPVDEQLELDKDDVMVMKPQAALSAQDFRRYWRVVKTLARVHYIGDAHV